ncbi:hypothetical protein ES288_A04G050800v1 [Gossypium darwinii]|uniref:Pentacotripeptide-repeat region of PRORP domain-containing protein n=1 Tax=Gossypium darwinii TaxID=34276 RepID=A0A5D2GTM4_GOSDA|nr:hypothetical protein ES288_A04G050800v1 [Gossypium darwinii]
MPVRGKGKTDHCFDNVDHALSLFNKMIEKYPKPSIVEFTKLFATIVRMKHYVIVVSMCSQMELLGVSHDVYSVSISINCFCQLGRIDFGFSVLGKMLKLGVEPDVVIFSTLINRLCNQSNISVAVCVFDIMFDIMFLEKGLIFMVVFSLVIFCKYNVSIFVVDLYSALFIHNVLCRE